MRMPKSIGVVGSGMIGASLAALFTGNGYDTVMYAVDAEQEKRGIEIYEQSFRVLISQGLVTETQYEACARRLKTTCNYQEMCDVEFVFECVFESLEAKHSVYQNLERNCPRIMAIASSTSAISADELAEGLTAKEKLIVAHPWNPPHLAPCVEVVRSTYTSDNATEVTRRILEDVGKEVVVLKKGIPGFIGNRLQYAMYREAVYLLEQGVAEAEEIDRTLKYSFAPRYTSIGIFEHFDNCGLDLARDIENYLFPTLCNDAQASRLVIEHCGRSEYGVKSGKGMIDWSKNDPAEMKIRAAEPFLKFFNWRL